MNTLISEPFNLGENDDIQVTVVAENEIGDSEHVQFTATMPGRPDPFVSASWSDIGKHQATLNWVIGERDGNNPIQNVGIRLFNSARV